ncbi:DUF3302 domain-containing protein [Hoeflea prorocentri]|uniref:DUF3302 domain-containing protein n=1 Tax=Hoeflea prorocentri TaxID=1922333 RepID=A0A9X3UMD4_9HYPH|nr:DUF3302 domain-containing protein [Hoeflea prorocentri]MCY6383515.1 DUF3302 domain-containing protein [Hoeflea prorocentri]MDA5401315.1 DUF3302 domain-containing protein [Hoeflea prorocentri]
MHLIDWQLTGYDYLTFLFILILIIAFFYILIQIGSLPGKIAERRNHPHAGAVKIIGWIGLFTVFPWVHAIIWAMHEATLVDIRTMPDSDVDLEAQPASVYGIPLPAGPETGAGAHRVTEAQAPADADEQTMPAQNPAKDNEPDKTA